MSRMALKFWSILYVADGDKNWSMVYVTDGTKIWPIVYVTDDDKNDHIIISSLQMGGIHLVHNNNDKNDNNNKSILLAQTSDMIY